MLFFQNLTTLLSLIEISTIGQQFAHILQNICVATAREQDTRTFIYMRSDGASSDNLNVPLILQKLRTQNPTAVINIDIHTPVARYRDQFNHKLLSIVQLSRSQNAVRDGELLLSLWQRLHRNRKSRLILLFSEDAGEEYVVEVLRVCAKQHAINVIALHPHMAVMERSYHALQIFLAKKIVRRYFSSSYRATFPNHLEDMNGHPLRLIEMKLYPQIYNYKAKDGRVALSGFIGRALAEYTKRRNGTIEHIPLSKSDSFLYPEIIKALDNDIADIAPLFFPQYTLLNLSLFEAAHHTSFCLMVPVESPLPKFTFYYTIIKKSALVLFCFTVILISGIVSIITRWNDQRQIPLTDYCVTFSVPQGLIGMPFWISSRTSNILKFICVLISLAGIIIGTAYETYLQSFTINAPLEKYAENIGDLLKRGIKVAMFAEATEFLHQLPDFADYAHNLTIYKNLTELLALQDTLDTRYAFLVSDMWTIYDKQQKYFSRPLFRFSDICITKGLPMSLPLQDDSVYYEDLNQLFSKLHAAGLVNFWLGHSYVELVAMDVIQLEDRNKKPGFVSLKLEDLHGVFGAMGALIILSIFCFVLEIFWMKIPSVFKSTRYTYNTENDGKNKK